MHNKNVKRDLNVVEGQIVCVGHWLIQLNAKNMSQICVVVTLYSLVFFGVEIIAIYNSLDSLLVTPFLSFRNKIK